ncbi:MAG: AAA family ATPase [Chloroflexi bacterium]|nr:AAA family ATPase [Chloroflexota bacterium]
METRVTDDLSSLLMLIPSDIAQAIKDLDRNDNLLEIILDLGRVPTARYTDGEYVLVDREVAPQDIELVVLQVGDFDADNRAGIERSLHRISALRNRRGEVVGLTCRVGRAVFGTIEIIQDIIESGRSLLFLGRPGVGKTTMLREAARVLAEAKRVVIVDTSNEIGGDGDIPHPAVGKARRIQVPMPSLQHEVMIEAVENHNPEVIIIDEIGRELEALAARTINERGVQLIGTAHGITLDNLLLNPTLSDLVGGIESVTLSDEEARRRGTQKTVLERRAPPTFDVVIEIQTRDQLTVHHDVTQSVDTLLRGRPPLGEIRRRAATGEILIEAAPAPQAVETESPNGGKSKKRNRRNNEKAQVQASEPAPIRQQLAQITEAPQPDIQIKSTGRTTTLVVYPYGIARNRLIEAARRFKVPLNITDSLDDADLLMTLKNFYRRRPRLIADAEQRGIQIFVLRSNTITQIENAVIDLFELEVEMDEDDEVMRAIREAEEGIKSVLGGVSPVDLSPQAASIRRRQHEVIRQANLISHSYGKEPNRHVRIFRP